MPIIFLEDNMQAISNHFSWKNKQNINFSSVEFSHTVLKIRNIYVKIA